MKTKIFYKQMGRSFRTLLTNGVILLVVTAFFVMSLNLYSGSVRNLQKAEETYRTIAVAEFYGDVDNRGVLTDPDSEDYMGYLSVAVDGYDISPLVNASGVIDYDLRARYVAYIPGQPSKSDLNEGLTGQNFMNDDNIIRFTLAQDEPVTIPISWNEEYESYHHNFPNKLFLNVQQTAADFLWYDSTQFHSQGVYMGESPSFREYYADQVKQLNRSEETEYVILYPGVEYVSTTRLMDGWKIRDGSKGKYVGNQIFYPTSFPYFTEDHHVYYNRRNEEYSSYEPGYYVDQPFPVARWEDVQNDPELKARWDAAWQAVEYNMCAYNVCFTDDITGVPVFHLGGAFLSDGRAITQEEYDTGAKVCMVSRKMAMYHGWVVGSKLDMHFFQYEGFRNRNEEIWWDRPTYHKETEGFFDSGEYEIVGIYDQRALVGNSGIAPSTLAMPWNLIYLPHNSVQNAPAEEERPVHATYLTIWLENGSIDEFLVDMDALGITDKPAGQYHPSFTFFDQGYSLIQPGLQSMHSTARLLLILSTLLLAVTCLLLAYFFAHKQKHNIGIFRMLGGRKPQAVAAVLLCALTITLLCAALGGVVGHSLTADVGQRILGAAPTEEDYVAALRAYVLTAEEGETVDLSVRPDTGLTVLASCGALLFPLLVLAFLLGYIGREPRALLPQNKT